MSRVVLISAVLATILAVPSGAQLKKKPDQADPKDKAPAQQKAPPAQAEPAEEDESLLPKTYSFNPIEANKNIKVAAFYWKKGNYKAAAMRYLEATRWDPGSAEAWLKLGEAREKLNDTTGARGAFEKFLEVAPDDKEASTVRKRLAELPPPAAKQPR